MAKIPAREAHRRAVSMAAWAIIGAIESGWNLHDYTDDGSDEQARQIEGEIRKVAEGLLRKLPEGYEPSYVVQGSAFPEQRSE